MEPQESFLWGIGHSDSGYWHVSRKVGQDFQAYVGPAILQQKTI